MLGYLVKFLGFSPNNKISHLDEPLNLVKHPPSQSMASAEPVIQPYKVLL